MTTETTTMTTETTTATDVARIIVDQMSDDDRDTYDRDAWLEDVSRMIDGEWAHLTEDDVLDVIDHLLGHEVEVTLLGHGLHCRVYLEEVVEGAGGRYGIVHRRGGATYGVAEWIPRRGGWTLTPPTGSGDLWSTTHQTASMAYAEAMERAGQGAQAKTRRQ